MKHASQAHLSRRGDTDWMAGAACRGEGVNPEWFYPDLRVGRPGLSYERRAKWVCKGCPVKAQCLADAMAIDDQWAILGGLTAEERTNRRKPRGRAVSA